MAAAEEMNMSSEAGLSGRSSKSDSGNESEDQAVQQEDKSDEGDPFQHESDDEGECICFDCVDKRYGLGEYDNDDSDDSNDNDDDDGEKLEDDGNDDGPQHEEDIAGEEGYDGDDEDADDHNGDEDDVQRLTTALAMQPVSLPLPRRMAIPRGRFARPTPRPFNYATQNNHLLNLPGEIRNMIWRYAIIDGDREVTIGTWGPVLNLKGVSRQIRNEILFIWRRETTFNLGLYKTMPDDLSVAGDKLIELMRAQKHVPVLSLRKISITLAVYTQERFTGITTTSFFRLALRVSGVKPEVTLHTIPGPYDGPSQESCICPLMYLIPSFAYCNRSVYATVVNASFMFAPIMIQPSDLLCGKCGKRQLCDWNWPLLQAEVGWWTAHAKFRKCMKEMKEMK